MIASILPIAEICGETIIIAFTLLIVISMLRAIANTTRKKDDEE